MVGCLDEGWHGPFPDIYPVVRELCAESRVAVLEFAGDHPQMVWRRPPGEVIAEARKPIERAITLNEWFTWQNLEDPFVLLLTDEEWASWRPGDLIEVACGSPEARVAAVQRLEDDPQWERRALLTFDAEARRRVMQLVGTGGRYRKF